MRKGAVAPVDPKPEKAGVRIAHSKGFTRAERSQANKAKHAAMLAEVRAEEKKKKEAAQKSKPVPKKPVGSHPLKLEGGIEWNRAKVMEILCERISTRKDSVVDLLKEGWEGITLPSLSVVQYWLATDQACLDQYTQAKAFQAELLGDEMIQIADDARNDYMERFDQKGQSLGYALNGEHVQRSKLRIDTRRWLMEKLNPKRFGNKVAIGGDEDGVPIRHNVAHDLSSMNKDALLALKAFKEAMQGKGEE